MLFSLHIANVAIIKELNIDFDVGFTALTGETGAGKSILIDSIGFLLGNRLSRDVLRSGETKASVSGLFGALRDEERSALEGIGVTPDEDGTLLIERTLSEDGRSQCRINGRMVNLSLLKEAASYLVHIHGQDDIHLLAERGFAQKTLDEYADLTEDLEQYGRTYAEYLSAKKALKAHLDQESERLRLEETLKRQIADIKKIAPKIGEEDALAEKKNRLKHSEKITRLSSFAYRALKGGEKGSALLILERTLQSLEQLSEFIPSLSEQITALNDCIATVDGIAEEVAVYVSEDEDPTAQLNAIEERLDVLYRLSRKYGGSVEAALAFLANAEEKLYSLENYDDRRKELENAFETLRQKIEEQAYLLHRKRLAAAEKMTACMTKVLTELDMPSIHMQTEVTLASDGEGHLLPDENGADQVSFLFSSNVGEGMAVLEKIASGGEMARVMLALRYTLAARTGIGTCIYDEIDAGVSGKTARKIGIKIKNAATSAQVLCVTHSAQIASLADQHILISKKETDGRTQTNVRALSHDARVEEIARILGGISVSDAQRAVAEEMLAGLDVKNY